MKYGKRILTLLLALTLVMTLFAGCQTREGEGEEGVSETSETSEPIISTTRPPSFVLKDQTKDVLEMKELNEDTVGWLRIPNTPIDEVVVCNYEDNQYYRFRTFEKEQSKFGVLYADRRSSFGDGSREQIGLNTCIYGHALTDVEENELYTEKFAPLHDFRDPDLARDLPYLFFSTESENYAFEVFAVFVANTDNPALPYNRNDVEPEVFYNMIQEEVLPRSLYNYDVEIKEGDKFLTLSTCIYTLPNGVKSGYPDTYYRYGVMARLVDESEELKEEASFTINEDVIFDPDGPWAA